MTPASLLLKVTVITAVALGVARLAHRGRAAVRHLILAGAFAVILLLPLASMTIPAIQVELPIDRQGAAAGPAFDRIVGTFQPESASSVVGPVPLPPPPSPIPFATIAIVVWLAGAGIQAVFLVVGLLQVRRMRRAGLPWREGQTVTDALAAAGGIRRGVVLLLHESARGPMTCGVRAPAIVLPMSAPSWDAADLHRAIVHELEHIRRGDWVSQGLAAAVCAAYWFHPLLWLANRRLALEAERACDDAVLRQSEAVAYADQLVELARALSAAPRPLALGMAHRADLAARVTAVLDSRQRRGRAGVAWTALCCVATFALVLTISPLRFVPVAAQSADAGQRFEVVSIKPCREEALPPTESGARGGGPSRAAVSPGRAYWACATADELIQRAYAGPESRLLNSLTRPRPGDPKNVRNGPAWVYADKFEVEAKAPGQVAPRIMLGPMLRALLEDRFQLKTHRETEERSIYQLTIGSGGLKLTPTTATDCWEYDPQGQTTAPADAEGKPPCGSLYMNWNGGNRLLRATGMTLQQFTDGTLSGAVLDRFVVNKTGLEGRFNIPLEFAPDDNTPGGLGGLEYSRRAGTEPWAAPTIFKALERLGLKVEAVKAPAEYLVIDRIERPKIER